MHCVITPDDVSAHNKSLFETGLFHDVLVLCGDVKFKCHRSVLSVSPELNREFQAASTQCVTAVAGPHVIEIAAVDSDLGAKFLRCLYGHSIVVSGEEISDITRVDPINFALAYL